MIKLNIGGVFNLQEPGEHGPLIGYASDGFEIYGYGDYWGMPVVDECHGHFGIVPEAGVSFLFSSTPYKAYCKILIIISNGEEN